MQTCSGKLFTGTISQKVHQKLLRVWDLDSCWPFFQILLNIISSQRRPYIQTRNATSILLFLQFYSFKKQIPLSPIFASGFFWGKRGRRLNFKNILVFVTESSDFASFLKKKKTNSSNINQPFSNLDFRVPTSDSKQVFKRYKRFKKIGTKNYLSKMRI